MNTAIISISYGGSVNSVFLVITTGKTSKDLFRRANFAAEITRRLSVQRFLANIKELRS